MSNVSEPLENRGILEVLAAKPSVSVKPASHRIFQNTIPVFAAAAFFLFCLIIQSRTGAWSAPFSGYPDEPSHFVSGVMLRDYIASGFHTNPFAFAEEYYSRYPYFAVGYWPPFFYVVMAFWFFLVGVGRIQALIVVAAASAGTAWIVFHLLKRRAGPIAAFCAGLVFLALPEVQRWTCSVMLDGMVAFFCVASAVLCIRYLRTERFVDGLGFAVCAGCSTLTKYSGAYVCLLCFTAIILLRRFSLLRKPSFLIQPLVIAAMVGPWIFWTRHFSSTGLLGFVTPFWHRLLSAPLDPFKLFPTVLAVFIAAGVIGLVATPRAWDTDVAVVGLMYLGLAGSFVVAPVEVEHRYVLAGGAALLVLSFSGWAALAGRFRIAGEHSRIVVTTAIAIVTLIVLSVDLMKYPRAHRYNVRPVVSAFVHGQRQTPARVVVPPDLEGPTIAVFSAQAPVRRDYELRRPIKMFSSGDWFLRNYTCRFHNADEMQKFLETEQVGYMIWHGFDPARNLRHEVLMHEMLEKYSKRWRKTASFGPTPDDAFVWDIYQLVAE